MLSFFCYADDTPQSKSGNSNSADTSSKIPELTMREEINESRHWRESCPIGNSGEVKRIDLKVIEPYKKVLSHGGYYHHYNTAQLTKNNSLSRKIDI